MIKKLKKFFWYATLLLSVVLLLLSLFWPHLLGKLPFLRPVLRCENLGAALAGAARTLAVLTLLATAVDQAIQEIAVRDILSQEYSCLPGAYALFFLLMVVCSIAGDLHMSASALASFAGAALLAVWFFGLSISLLFSSGRRRELFFDFCADSAGNRRLPLYKRRHYLQTAVACACDEPLCARQFAAVLQAAVRPYTQPDEAASGACLDDWEEDSVREGVSLAETAYLALRKANRPAEQIDSLCMDVLLAAWKQPIKSRCILLTGFVSALFQKENTPFFAGCQELIYFCGALRDAHRGEEPAERIIGSLACACGMALSIARVCRELPAVFQREDLDGAWAFFLNHAGFDASAYIKGSRTDELERLLRYMEWSTRKMLHFSETAYHYDRLQIAEPINRAPLAKEMSNLKLLSFMIDH